MAQDILEDNIVKYGRSLLDILLQDKTTKKNIIWATDDYEKYGDMYKAWIRWDWRQGFTVEIPRDSCRKRLKMSERCRKRK